MLEPMAHCPGCGAPTDVTDRFCGRCGKALAGVAPVETGLSRFCAGCGGSLEADARFCRRCGAVAPEPKEDVFAGMAAPGNGHEAVSGPPLVAELFVPPPAPTLEEAPTESIPRPSAPRVTPPPPPRPRAIRRPDTPPHPAEATTGTIERTPPPAQLGEVLPTEPAGPERETWEESIPRGAGFPWGGTLALLGALVVIMSAVLDWGGPFEASMPRDISVAWLLEPEAPSSGPTLGLVLLLVGVLGALVSLLAMASPGWTFLRRLLGLLTATIPVGFALRTLQAVASESSVFDLPSALGVGVLVAAGGGILQLVAPRPPRT
jgi:hypothetical protein